MALIKYIEADGREYELELSSIDTVMTGALDNGVEGIIGECGGICGCATCHVYIDPEYIDKIPEIDMMEETRLNFAIDKKSNSRLSCQINITDDLDGMVVKLPERQY